jgi:NitT/TauT family transport system substrate-binding protein
MTKTSKWIKVFSLLLILSYLVACSGSTPAPRSTPIKIGWTLWQGDYTLLVAYQMGFFREHGVDVQPYLYGSESQGMLDLAGAKLDGGLFTMSDTLLASSLANLKVVMISDQGGQYSVVASPDIKSLNDLRGKRIGLNIHTSSELFIYDMLKTRRITPKDVTYVEMSPDQVVRNIPYQIDAGVVWEPYTSQALKQGKVLVYQNPDESNRIPRLIVFRQSVVEQRSQEIQAFIEAWDEAVQYRINHPEETLSIISKFTGFSASDLNLTGNIKIYTIADNLESFALTAGSDYRSIFYIAGFTQDFLLMEGYLTSFPHFSTLLDPSFLK